MLHVIYTKVYTCWILYQDHSCYERRGTCRYWFEVFPNVLITWKLSYPKNVWPHLLCKGEQLDSNDIQISNEIKELTVQWYMISTILYTYTSHKSSMETNSMLWVSISLKCHCSILQLLVNETRTKILPQILPLTLFVKKSCVLQ